MARRQLAARYRERLAGLPLGLPAEQPRAQATSITSSSCVIRRRDALAKALAELGVGTMVHYPLPVPGQPLFGLDGREALAPRVRGPRARCSRCPASRR